MPNTQLKNNFSQDLITVTENTSIAIAYSIMREVNVRHLPVVSELTGEVRGLISDRDLLMSKHLIEDFIINSHLLNYSTLRNTVI